MTFEDGDLVPSFASHPDGQEWCGVIYAMRDELGPELLSYCPHRHPLIHEAIECAHAELTFARRVVALADERRPS
jgi:hypothetical protein